MAKKKNDNATGAGLYIGCLLMMTIGIVFITLFSIAIQLIPLAVPIIIFLIFVKFFRRFVHFIINTSLVFSIFYQID